MSEFFDGDALAASKYFKRFEKLRKEYPELLTLKGDNILVEKLPKLEMKSKSGLILSANINTHKNTMGDALTEFGIVLLVGPGQFLDDGASIECDAKPGDVILLPTSVMWYSQFGHIADYESYSIGRLRDGQIPLWFKDYKKAFAVLNEVDKPVEVDGVAQAYAGGGEP